MPRMPLHRMSGGAIVEDWVPKAIRFVRYGCANRPFFHIVVMDRRIEQRCHPIEQLGTYDIMENKHNERLLSLNFERIQHWLGQGNVTISRPVLQLMGLCGFLPIHPTTYMAAWRNRRTADEAKAKENQTEAATP